MSRRAVSVSLASFVGCVFASPVAMAGQLSVQGNVTLLDNVDQLAIVVGTADFNSGLAPIPLDYYADQGMTLHEGSFAAILPGVIEVGMGVQPFFFDLMGGYFPDPIAGGGVAVGASNIFGGVVTFSDPITQFGAVGSTEGPQYITVWDQNGVMLGQVTWVLNADAAFFGVDTNGVPIGMLTYGTDDVWAGMPYNTDDGGITITDTWMWGLAIACDSELDCPDDANGCTDQVCVGNFCDYQFNVAPCNDGDACTEQDACSEGECVAVDVDCEDNNLCSMDSCDSQIGCINQFIDGCCLADEDCPEGEICLIGSNSCIPDGGDSTGDGDTTTTTTGDGDGDTTTTTGDGDGDSSDGDSEGSGDGEASSGADEIGGDSGGAIEEPAGCACASDSDRGGGLLGLLALVLFLPFIERRRTNTQEPTVDRFDWNPHHRQRRQRKGQV